MFEIVCFDICAIAILIIILFSFYFRDIVSDKASKRLVYLILVTMLVGICDIIANVNNGRSDRVILNYFFSGAYHVLRNVTFYLYNNYIVLVTATRRNKKKSVIGVLRYSPIFLSVLLALTAPFTHFAYFYDEAGYYMRGKGFFCIYILVAVYAVAAFYIIVRNIPLLGKKKAISLMSCAVFSFAASIVQYSKPYLVIDIIGFSLSILFIILFVDNPGDKVDDNSTLMNRQAYMNELRVVIYSNSPVDIIHINMTNHKAIEEMLSYSNYLVLVKNISSKLKELDENTKASAKLYYIKNGRFRVILEKNSIERTDAFAKEVLDIFNSTINVNGRDVSVESSVCITQCPEDFNIFDNLLDFSEIAARYEQAGTIVYSKDIMKQDNYDDQININKLIEEGIVNRKIEMLYKPIYSIDSQECKGVDVCIRLTGNYRKYISEEMIISAAEQNGSIIELAAYGLEEICKFISSDEFKKTKIDRVSSKVSVASSTRKEFPEKVLGMLKKYNVPPEKIRFKITESIASDQQKVFAENIEILSKEGIAFALDGYGSGYSNIATLSTLPIDVVIIDESFPGGEISERTQLIFENTVRMLKSFGKKVAISGVSDNMWEDKIKALECDYIIGGLHTKAMTKDELIAFYQRLEA